MLSIELPTIKNQRLKVLKIEADLNCKKIQDNLNAPHYPSVKDEALSAYSQKHLLTESEGWEAPNSAIIRAFFEQFQAIFPEYSSDEKLAKWLGLTGKQADRRMREYKKGDREIPYGIWRKFLISTGRVSQEIIPVIGIFDLD